MFYITEKCLIITIWTTDFESNSHSKQTLALETETSSSMACGLNVHARVMLQECMNNKMQQDLAFICGTLEKWHACRGMGVR